MFNFFKKSKPALANKLLDLSSDASEQFLNYLKEDSVLYGKCINDNPIRNTSFIFVLNLYRDVLLTKYNHEDVFFVVRTAILSSSTNKASQEMAWTTLVDYMKICKEAIETYKEYPDFDSADILTKVYFALVIDDKEYMQNEWESSIPLSVSYRKIYNYINGIGKWTPLLDDNYNLRLK